MYEWNLDLVKCIDTMHIKSLAATLTDEKLLRPKKFYSSVCILPSSKYCVNKHCKQILLVNKTVCHRKFLIEKIKLAPYLSYATILLCLKTEQKYY